MFHRCFDANSKTGLQEKHSILHQGSAELFGTPLGTPVSHARLRTVKVADLTFLSAFRTDSELIPNLTDVLRSPGCATDMTLLKKLIAGSSAILGLLTTVPAGAGDVSSRVIYSYRVRVCSYGYAPDRYYNVRKFRGGWYALNYPYYWGYGPMVSYSDPYDYNGNYFPYPLPRR